MSAGVNPAIVEVCGNVGREFGLKWTIVLNYVDCLVGNHMLAVIPPQNDVR